jgi:hypothetical protein
VAWQGKARRGQAWQGKARVTRLAYCGSFPQRVNVMAGQGQAMLGKARHGTAWHGTARQGCFGTWWRFRKSSRLGVARRGMAGQGKVWHGEGFHFQTLTKD